VFENNNTIGIGAGSHNIGPYNIFYYFTLGKSSVVVTAGMYYKQNTLYQWYTQGEGWAELNPPPHWPCYVINLLYYNKRRSTNHDISENGFEATFCILSIIYISVMMYSITIYYRGSGYQIPIKKNPVLY